MSGGTSGISLSNAQSLNASYDWGLDQPQSGYTSSQIQQYIDGLRPDAHILAVMPSIINLLLLSKQFPIQVMQKLHVPAINAIIQTIGIPEVSSQSIELLTTLTAVTRNAPPNVVEMLFEAVDHSTLIDALGNSFSSGENCILILTLLTDIIQLEVLRRNPGLHFCHQIFESGLLSLVASYSPDSEAGLKAQSLCLGHSARANYGDSDDFYAQSMFPVFMQLLDNTEASEGCMIGFSALFGRNQEMILPEIIDRTILFLTHPDGPSRHDAAQLLIAHVSHIPPDLFVHLKIVKRVESVLTFDDVPLTLMIFEIFVAMLGSDDNDVVREFAYFDWSCLARLPITAMVKVPFFIAALFERTTTQECAMIASNTKFQKTINDIISVWNDDPKAIELVAKVLIRIRDVIPDFEIPTSDLTSILEDDGEDIHPNIMRLLQDIQ